MLRQLRHEREDGEISVTVHKHVLDELFGGKAVDRIVVATGGLGEVGEDLFPILAGGAAPISGGIDHVGLNVEDELVTGEGTAGSCALVGRLFGQAKAAARVAPCCERLV